MCGKSSRWKYFRKFLGSSSVVGFRKVAVSRECSRWRPAVDTVSERKTEFSNEKRERPTITSPLDFDRGGQARRLVLVSRSETDVNCSYSTASVPRISASRYSAISRMFRIYIVDFLLATASLLNSDSYERARFHVFFVRVRFSAAASRFSAIRTIETSTAEILFEKNGTTTRIIRELCSEHRTLAPLVQSFRKLRREIVRRTSPSRTAFLKPSYEIRSWISRGQKYYRNLGERSFSIGATISLERYLSISWKVKSRLDTKFSMLLLKFEWKRSIVELVAYSLQNTDDTRFT